MAKTRRIKRGKVRVARTRAVKARTARVKVVETKPTIKESHHSIYGLNLAAGIVTLLAGILVLFFGNLFALFELPLGSMAALPNIVCGAVILILTLVTMKRHFRLTNVFVLIFSLIALATPPNGFIIGPVLGLIGSIYALART